MNHTNGQVKYYHYLFCLETTGVPFLLLLLGDCKSAGTPNIMKPTMNKQIVQMASGQFPKILFLTTLSNHYDILGRCRSFDERLFYILYAHKERLSHKELQRPGRLADSCKTKHRHR